MADALGTKPKMPIATAVPPPAPLGGVQTLATLAVVTATIVALYFGADILIPIALAVLLSFALAPLVNRLRRLGLPRVPAVLAVVILTFLAIGGFGLVVGSQLAQLAENLPRYEQNIRAKVRSLQASSPGGGILVRAGTMLRDLGEEIREAQQESSSPTPSERGRVTIERATDEPITVRVEEPPPTAFEVIENVALPLLAPIGTAGIVVVFVIFILLEREDLRDRLIRLVSGGNLHQTTEAMNEAAKRVSRYLLMQLVVNATYGIPIGLGLWLIGVPNALLWGLLATVLRFVPYVGPFIAALFPIALSLAVDPGWTMLLWTIALFLGLELISNNVVEPWLYGSSTGMSTVAILIAAVFWTTLWGPVGLLLSTPLTVCLAVVGRYVPQLAFLDVMLGSEPVLTPPERLYQRMLAGDPDEGEDIAEEFLEDRPLAAFYDEVALPALRLAEADRAAKVLVGERRALVTESFVKVVSELADHDDGTLDETGTEAGPRHYGPAWASGKPVACIAGRSGLDRGAAAMLAQLLERRGIGARVLPTDVVTSGGIAGLDLAGTELVCLFYLGTAGVAHARLACRRLRRRAPGLKIMVGLLSGQVNEGKSADLASGLSADLVAVSLGQAVQQVEALAAASAQPRGGPPAPPPVPANEPQRLEVLRSLNLLDTPPEEAFDRLTRRAAAAFKVPICLVSLVDEDRQFWKSATGLPDDLAATRQAPRQSSICGHVVAEDAPIVIDDVLKDERFATDPFLRERGIRFYAGAPLRVGGVTVGTLCLIDTEPRTLSEQERALLQSAADEVARVIEHRHHEPGEERQAAAG